MPQLHQVFDRSDCRRFVSAGTHDAASTRQRFSNLSLNDFFTPNQNERPPNFSDSIIDSIGEASAAL